MSRLASDGCLGSQFQFCKIDFEESFDIHLVFLLCYFAPSATVVNSVGRAISTHTKHASQTLSPVVAELETAISMLQASDIVGSGGLSLGIFVDSGCCARFVTKLRLKHQKANVPNPGIIEEIAGFSAIR